MKLRHIYLSLESLSYSPEPAVSFGFRTRYLCNYLERTLETLRFDAQGFGRICIIGAPSPSTVCEILGENALCTSVFFDARRYASLTPDQSHELFIEMLLEGLRRSAETHALPLTEIRAAIDEFRRIGYRNEWVEKKRRLSDGRTAELRCSLDMDAFVLRVVVHRRGVELFSAVALQTPPDEIIFAHRVKDAREIGGRLVVLDKFGNETWSVSMADVGSLRRVNES